MQQFVFFSVTMLLIVFAAARLMGAGQGPAGGGTIYGLPRMKKPVSPLRFRGCDKFGCGYFGASRDGGTRTHMGTDIITTTGEAVKAPISGRVVSFAAYAQGRHPELRAVRIVGEKYDVNIMYITPATSGYVLAGDTVGYAQSLQNRYPGIPDHIHLEMVLKTGQKIDAKPYLT